MNGPNDVYRRIDYEEKVKMRKKQVWEVSIPSLTRILVWTSTVRRRILEYH